MEAAAKLAGRTMRGSSAGSNSIIREHADPVRVGIVADFPEEKWESMDLVAEMATAEFAARIHLGIEPLPLTPPYRRMLGRISTGRAAWNFDRLMNRRWTLPRGVRQAIRSSRPEIAFVVDHSYAHIIPVIRAENVPVVVMCHDLDAFRDLITPIGNGSKARLRRQFARPILEGMLQADLIVTGSNVVRDELLTCFGDRVPSERTVTIPYGVAPEFLGDPVIGNWPFHGLGDVPGPMLLHVGSTIPRKRIDILLETVAEIAKSVPGVTLVRVGGKLTTDQQSLAESLGIAHRIREMPRLSRDQIAELYRRSYAVLVTSDAEGFGLPVAEALACGAEVVASDIPVLRETGGDCVRYATVGDASEFAKATLAILAEQGAKSESEITARQEWSARYRWETFAHDLAKSIRGLMK
jgi:glycosyltransferase involved in cell wall biosynthesis